MRVDPPHSNLPLQCSVVVVVVVAPAGRNLSVARCILAVRSSSIRLTGCLQLSEELLQVMVELQKWQQAQQACGWDSVQVQAPLHHVLCLETVPCTRFLSLCTWEMQALARSSTQGTNSSNSSSNRWQEAAQLYVQVGLRWVVLWRPRAPALWLCGMPDAIPCGTLQLGRPRCGSDSPAAVQNKNLTRHASKL